MFNEGIASVAQPHPPWLLVQVLLHGANKQNTTGLVMRGDLQWSHHLTLLGFKQLLVQVLLQQHRDNTTCHVMQGHLHWSHLMDASLPPWS
jgi:hypothetical protein